MEDSAIQSSCSKIFIHDVSIFLFTYEDIYSDHTENPQNDRLYAYPSS